jgi:hypothetical protein
MKRISGTVMSAFSNTKTETFRPVIATNGSRRILTGDEVIQQREMGS